MRIKKFLTACGLILAIALCVPALPASAQDSGSGSAPPGFLSDASGPAIDNLGVSSRTAILIGAPTDLRATNINMPLPVIMGQADTPGTIAVLDNVIAFNRSMDKLMPFCGCTNVNWRSYNHTIQVATQLRGSLAASVAEQQKILTSNPTPQQMSAVQKRLQAIETTTSALENAVTILNRLGKALDITR